MNDVVIKDNFYNNIRDILQTARDRTYKQVNFIMVEAYWNIGKQIVEEEQHGKHRAKYGSALIKELSKRLTLEFGKGFTSTNLKMMRQFYNTFPNSHTLCDQLTWSHYRLIIRVQNQNAREWYMNEAVQSNWSVRALERQIGTHYYERIISSRDKQIVEQEAKEKTKDLHDQNKLLMEEKNFSTSLVEAQDNFIKHSIHEINTPLAVIMTHIDLFKMKEGTNKYLSKIEAASKIIANIYDDLSYMVKKNRFEYTKQHLNFSTFIEERIDFFSEIALGNNHEIISNIQPDIWITMSPEELQRIVDNNLSNAIKYAYKGTKIEICLDEDTDVILTFKTASPKIDNTERIFKAFERENSVRGGFGLGLEIVYSIAQKEKIEIDVISTEKYTIFSYTFKKDI